MEYGVNQGEPHDVSPKSTLLWVMVGGLVLACVMFATGFLAGVYFEKNTNTSGSEAYESQHDVSNGLSTTSTSTDVEESVTESIPAQDGRSNVDESIRNEAFSSEKAEYALVCIGMSNAHQECADWLVKINGSIKDEIDPKLEVINCAVGSHAIERWNDDSYNDILWDACIEKVHDAGLEAGDVQYVWHKAMVQYVRDEQNDPLPPYPNANSAYYKLVEELNIFSTRLPQYMPNVEMVFTSGRSYGGFAVRPDRGEPLAELSNQAIAEWLRDNQTVAGIAYVQGPDLWAPACADRRGAELCYQREDYQRDGIHPAQGALNKITRLLHYHISQFEWYVR